jgi:hypothetical protein
VAYSKVIIDGNNEKEILDSLFSQCSNNNQICYHLKKYPNLIQFLKEETGLNSDTIILLYHYKENIKEIPKCLCRFSNDLVATLQNNILFVEEPATV